MGDTGGADAAGGAQHGSGGTGEEAECNISLISYASLQLAIRQPMSFHRLVGRPEREGREYTGRHPTHLRHANNVKDSGCLIASGAM